jgi:hypothetical protein
MRMSTNEKRADVSQHPGGSPPLEAVLADDLAACALRLSRRFAAGATLWAVAPAWVEHARHLAVEFVHPAVVGKRALPAVAIDSADPVAALRPNVTAGDVLVLIGDAATLGALPLLRRAAAWGLMTVWIGAGERPPRGPADLVVWLDGVPAGTARHDGSVVRLYHVLWELTQVCLEHSGLLDPAPAPAAGDDCATCLDEGRAAEVLSLDGRGGASVRMATGVEAIDTSLVAPLRVGDLVLVHAGVAIAVVPEES